MKHHHLFLLVSVFFSLSTHVAFAFSGSGTGTASDPFQITSCVQLQEMNDDLDAYYQIMNNIDCSATKTDAVTWGADGFDPIGNTSNVLAFTGKLDGGNFTIGNLYINRNTVDDGTNNAGLFGRTLGATIQNLNLTNLEMIASHMAGGLVGLMGGGTVNNCNVTGTITPQPIATHALTWSDIGGLVGNSFGGVASASATIDGSTSNVNIDFDSETIDKVAAIGGFAGYTDSTDVSNSTSTGAVTVGTTSTSAESIGGFVGISFGPSTMSSSSTTSSVSVGNGAVIDSIGGFAGYTDSTDVSNSTSAGVVTIGSTTTQADSIGGFVGWSLNSSTINSSSTISSVFVGDGANINSIGGFVGYLESTISDSFARSSLTIGTTTSLDAVGGFAGIIYDGILQHSYSITLFDLGSSGTTTDIGGLVGNTSGTVSVVSSYWNTQVSGLTTSAGGEGVVGKTTAEMKTQSTYVGWDFVNIWGIQADINDGYPSFNPVIVAPQNNNSTSASSSSSGPAACADLPPLEIPNAFQTNAIDTKFAVFFVPLGSRVSGYVITFGANPDNFEHAATFGHAPEGVNKAIINDLAPNTTYYYKIRAQNGCMPGDWSPTHSFTTTKNNKTVQVTYSDGKIKLFRKR